MSDPGEGPQVQQVVRIHLSDQVDNSEANGKNSQSVPISPTKIMDGTVSSHVLPGFHPRTSLTLREQKRRLADDELRSKGRSKANTNVTIAYEDISVTLQVPEIPRGYQTVASPIVNGFKYITTLGKSNKVKDFHRIDKISGVVKPGTMTLILAPPGHGKSTFLKVVAGKIPHTSGQLYFNGRTAQQVHITPLLTYSILEHIYPDLCMPHTYGDAPSHLYPLLCNHYQMLLI